MEEQLYRAKNTDSEAVKKMDEETKKKYDEIIVWIICILSSSRTTK
jgi:hypothetical protein